MDKKVYIVILFFCFAVVFCQKSDFNEYAQLRKKYENYPDSDIRALPHINLYIAKAKQEKNYQRLFQGYKDAVMYSVTKEQKLVYSDSAVFAAKTSGNNDLISVAHLGKGVVYYYNYKKFKKALDEYMVAYEYSKHSKDEYFKHKILYHIGVVKSYLGYYENALALFEKCRIFFKSKLGAELHPNEIYNSTKGYYNTLHQMAICHRNLKNYKISDSLAELGLRHTSIDNDLLLENSYFLKCKGIASYRKKNYGQALKELSLSLPEIRKNADISWEPIIYFYMGKSFLAQGKTKEAIDNFRKVDSIFQNYHFILPELRENYELLIKYYRQQNNDKQQLYYTNQLLTVDEVLYKDFKYLVDKIHKEFDTQTLEEEKVKLEKANSKGILINSGLMVFASSLVIALSIRYEREKKIRRQYLALENKLMKLKKETSKPVIEVRIEDGKKYELAKDKIEELLHKLQVFEHKKRFTQKGLTIYKLAQQFNTNDKYLSYVINEYKGKNFTKYLSELRIEYITQLLFDEKKYLDYKIESLSEECGIASRQNFSNLFYEINGIRPTDFIRRRKAELLADLKSQTTIKSA
ncbi:helix-turn-helix domain-containing protein [Chryseobacterium rhizosphaerae]|uniref:helix-turn-helix domain-containing protein n=1 Tax=Chryseobacterium rhizosphaerae TaxID=395937 RepID=UPI002359297A|nr:helix-turn-helix domain-containing protein [Chryseobacterium rhizosphaerae]MDC8102682.1 AraC family transcriptional regulator [Chryseobacterium rhizosphaerae]